MFSHRARATLHFFASGMLLNSFTIAFVGGGNMATSLIKGLLNNGHPADQISVSDPDTRQVASLEALGVTASTDNASTVAHAEVIVIATKPQVLVAVLQDLRNTVNARQLLISIAAGTTVETIQNALTADQPIVRCMPNTPALIGKGMTVLHANACTTDKQRSLADTVLQAAGITRWVDEENLLDAVTAVSGSGPAYFFYLMEAMIATGEELGLSQELATILTKQTALGAAELAMQEGSPADLRRAVTSPGGTTAAALEVFDSEHLDAIISKALTAAQLRSQTLAKT